MNPQTSSLLALTLALLVAGTTTAKGATAVDEDLCRVIEALPDAKDPASSSPAFRSSIRSLKADLRKTRTGKSLRATRAKSHLGALERALVKTLKKAGKAFRLDADHRWSPARQATAKRFLGTHVLTRDASLRVGEFGFEPAPAIRALLLWSACWAGDRERVIRYGRGATRTDEGGARAMAALTLERAGRIEEARELLDRLDGEGFLVAWAAARLATDPDVRRRQDALARRRARTPWQRGNVGLEPLPEEEGP